MAIVLKTPSFWAPLSRVSIISSNPSKPLCVSFRHRYFRQPRISSLRSSRSVKLVPFCSNGEATETEVVPEPKIEENSEGVEAAEEDSEEAASDSDSNTEAPEVIASAALASLRSYGEALASNDESRIAEIESFIKSIEDEKIDLESNVASLSQELTTERERVLRISADFDNFRKRTERDRLSLVTNAQGEVVESLLPVLDNFERAKSQIKIQNEGEEKISNSYQSIYKQFVEILSSLGVVPVETTGTAFDPLLHEAIMREDSSEFKEGVIIQEFRKGFKLGDRLLRPSMVKVSAGPGPAKPEPEQPSEEADSVASETVEEGSTESA